MSALLLGARPPDAPDVLWAVVVEKVRIEEWALAYLTLDGKVTRISPVTTIAAWQSVHVQVDESTDTLVAQVHGSPAWTFTAQDLGASERIGAGDPFVDPLHHVAHLGPVGLTRLDDVALYGEGSA